MNPSKKLSIDSRIMPVASVVLPRVNNPFSDSQGSDERQYDVVGADEHHQDRSEQRSNYSNDGDVVNSKDFAKHLYAVIQKLEFTIITPIV